MSIADLPAYGLSSRYGQFPSLIFVVRGLAVAARAITGAVFVCGVVAGPAVAKVTSHRQSNAQEMSTTEALNEQQLQALSVSADASVAPQPGGCVLYAGRLIGQQLVGWGQKAGWHVLWHCGQDWVVPSSVEFHGGFVSAARQVLEDLAAEGASVRGVFYQGNRTLVVSGGGQ